AGMICVSYEVARIIRCKCPSCAGASIGERRFTSTGDSTQKHPAAMPTYTGRVNCGHIRGRKQKKNHSLNEVIPQIASVLSTEGLIHAEAKPAFRSHIA